MKRGIWIVVADATCARIFSAANHSAELIEQKDLLHSASSVPSATLTSDRSGRDTDIQHTGSHTMGHEKSAMNQEVHNFARETDLNLVKETLSTIRNHLPKQL